MLGVKRVEKILPTGTALTVVGEAMKDDIGTIRIQKPPKGPFYVSPKSIDQLIANLGKWARWYKFASLGFTIFGVYLMTTHAIRHIMERRRHHEWQRRVMKAAAQRREQNSHEGAWHTIFTNICISSRCISFKKSNSRSSVSQGRVRCNFSTDFGGIVN